MSLYGDLDDPWKTDQALNPPAAQNEWASLNSDTLAGSHTLHSETLISGVGAVSLRPDNSNAARLQVDGSSLLMGQQDGSSHVEWGDTVGEVNNQVSEGLSTGNLISGAPFTGAETRSTAGDANEDYEAWSNVVRKAYDPLSTDIVLVEEIPEREGLLFKHTNYLVRHLVDIPDTEPSSDKSVIRRYSDFVWLQEVLLKKYPFRTIPDLPPKRIGSSTSDLTFLVKRRNGLSRFINLVVKHPVLRKDDLVLTFLTVPTDLLSWRKNASYDTTEEFTDKKISSSFIKMWHKNMAERWNDADSSIDAALDIWAKITILVERHEKRLKFIGQDRMLLASMLDDFTENTTRLYATDNGMVSDINDHLGMVAKRLHSCNALIAAENQEMNADLSPRFKTFIDILLALKGLFERYKIMAGNNVPQLQRRIEVNTERMEQMKGKPDLKGADYDRIKQSIQRDRRSIAEQMNKSWLVRECILEEYVFFQETQFLISDIFQRWARLNMKYMELNSNEWETILDRIESMPTSR
ncbi:LANO_0A06304g1_1 [Lachancea nothofagi CBS 11611]|uniref:Sorting nexin MVP1 n=1 Tax=Lachancea nothofagi CBS 11611 TaxID=1266666 RepID=A0A1G4IRQ5_9SACH|nr:LANO_0A06304g1_1 [Lachancea nothofagi CBS 11611]